MVAQQEINFSGLTRSSYFHAGSPLNYLPAQAARKQQLIISSQWNEDVASAHALWPSQMTLTGARALTSVVHR